MKLGIERLNEHLHLFEGQKVGLITNATGRDARLCSSASLMMQHVELTTLFSPEHGLDGAIPDGMAVDHGKDHASGLTVYSLYGKNRKPTKAMLEHVDVLCFDIQDVGARYYTYISTMNEAMQAAKEYGIRFVVFDRPNPVGGLTVEGGLLKEAFSSFVGCRPIPVRHGLTTGELALLFNEHFKVGCDLHVVNMQGWQRHMSFGETGLPWVLPSPNIPVPETAYLYLATCFFEGTNVSEGRGTAKPFAFIGAPWLDGRRLIEALAQYELPGVLFRPITFIPTTSKYQDDLCHGIELHLTDNQTFRPVLTGLTLIDVIRSVFSEFVFLPSWQEGGQPMIDKLVGHDDLRTARLDLAGLVKRMHEEDKAFTLLKERYHLYGHETT